MAKKPSTTMNTPQVTPAESKVSGQTATAMKKEVAPAGQATEMPIKVKVVKIKTSGQTATAQKKTVAPASQTIDLTTKVKVARPETSGQAGTV